jgi:hypothetical protein
VNNTQNSALLNSTMSTKNMKKNTNIKTISIASSPKLDRIKSGLLIRTVIPKIKSTYPGVRYVRLEGGEWIFTSTSDNKAVTQMIRQAEAEVIQADQNLARAYLPEHAMGETLTAITISRLKSMMLPSGTKILFHNDAPRQWEFTAVTEEVLADTIARFKDLTDECKLVLDPPCVKSLFEHELGRKFTGFVIKNLRRIPLPKGAKRIVFENDRGLWWFACQTQEDMDILIGDFNDFEKILKEEFANPRTQPEDVESLPRKVAAPVFTGMVDMDFPMLGSETPAVV